MAVYTALDISTVVSDARKTKKSGHLDRFFLISYVDGCSRDPARSFQAATRTSCRFVNS